MYRQVRPKEDEELIQRAIEFLIKNYKKSGHNPKPVVIHSIRVAMYLYFSGADTNVVVAAALHDLLEDTRVTSEQITDEFGKKVTELVEANSFKSEIKDYTQQYLETFERNIAAGKNAVLIKAADLLDNSDYYKLSANDLQQKLFEKFSKFVEISERVIGDTNIWFDIHDRLAELKKELSI